ncbi:MAG: hydrogenase [Sphingobacteriales bacterium]|nr:hydrogenase [Sphingobacteriales bacterium]
MNNSFSRRLKMLGMLLLLLGLITGLVLMNFKNPRMGLSSHLEGILNGLLLVAAGFLWDELKLATRAKRSAGWLLLYGTYSNWFFTLLAAVLGTSRITPIAGAGYTGTRLQENILSAGFILVGLSMLVAVTLMVYGLRSKFKA